ncbi:hypothetical protein PMALA_015130 [Plasmodium malariae]|uniref:F-box domain-containing protein n=1 Tax=Plasmodium malariae TaxID=5858 RepID=A0A1A8VZY2_PLAMA|nr:hypothetical protein PMALA_015130 [Plasmodium malariae]
MNDFSSGVIKEILKFLTCKDVLTNKCLINKEFVCASNYNVLWKDLYKYEYFDDTIDRKKNDPFKQFLDMEASLLALAEDRSVFRFNITDLYRSTCSTMRSGGTGTITRCRHTGTEYNLTCKGSRNSPNYGDSYAHAICRSFYNLNEQLACRPCLSEKWNSKNEILEKVWIDQVNLNILRRKIQLTRDKLTCDKNNLHICSFKNCEFQYFQKNDLYICIESKNYHL